MTEITIAEESPRQDEVIAFIRELDAYHIRLYPAEANHLMDIDGLCVPEIRFFVARRAHEALGIGALWVKAAGNYGEIKRMYVRPDTRGLGVGVKLLGVIERRAQAERLDALMLETGTLNTEALGLYRRAGFHTRGPFGDYHDHPLCVFMEKRLGEWGAIA